MTTNAPSGFSGFGGNGPRKTDSVESMTDVFAILSNERRIWILEYLTDVGGRAAFGDIVDAVAERELEKPKAEISGEERQRIYIALSQTHVPTLKDEEVLDYERKTDEVWFGSRARDVLRYLRPASPLRRLWSGLSQMIQFRR